jgi:hypothetical protein
MHQAKMFFVVCANRKSVVVPRFPFALKCGKFAVTESSPSSESASAAVSEKESFARVIPRVFL